MAIKKSDLYSSLWKSCDELRGGMEPSEYKDYVLFMLFIKYVSDKYAGDDLAPLIIPPGASFEDMKALKGKPDIGDRINTQIIQPLIEANSSSLSHSDFPDFNDPKKLGDGKERQDKLTNLVAIFEDPALDFSDNRAEHDDILGDAYEYLMRHFAQDSGKSKGQFYTPAEVSRTIAQLIGIGPDNTNRQTTAYDPTCGSGSLLLKVAAEAGKPITLYGQEISATTAGLARMNMILHDFPDASVQSGNTLAAPRFKDGDRLKTFDYVVANPPFSDKAWSAGLTPVADPFQRFAWGVPPAKQGDYAYLLHIIRSLKASGKGACILPHGVLFRGNAEAAIRRQLVDSGYLVGIVGLPANLFYGTGIPACLLVLDKENATARRGIFMIDASKGFRKDGNKNRLREQDIHRIVDTFRKAQDEPGYARMVEFAEIRGAKNDYNLNLPRYIDSSAAEDLQDIEAHLLGGIPQRDVDALNTYWDRMPALRATLFESAGRDGYLQLKVPQPEVKSAILGHAEFLAFQTTVAELHTRWEKAIRPALASFGEGGHPKQFVHDVSESLLAAYRTAPLLDAYAVYQHLMDYWSQVMQDDAYLLAADGWKATPVVETNKKGKAKGWACDLVPKPLVVARYFAAEQQALDEARATLDSASSALEALEEEHGGEDGLFASLDKLNAAEVKRRIKEIGKSRDDAEELAALKQWVDLSEQEAELKKQVKALDAALDAEAFAKYPQLSVADVQTLVVDDKWRAALRAAMRGEVERISQALTRRVKQLAERYETPLPKLVVNVNTLEEKLAEHLTKMGFAWK
ncbi:type I restriction-modification system subunit M [Pseudoxanthomonas daejeonensis]|uniref:site-specific DNA-methyltransferase (adenine-specific) n=1 Tax=Pseudoxanthomonas daejeonensis TaxID=266062 RepID=A0ABQ6Z345_9GAMM|nr:class I SAM-dependent DNA methyltransferase [Pseudoxanthomonas daejeonensis]KAF1691718.1 type I restriction endonuclease subunit M [Pseudoxanthomonas daejeonensis]